MPLSRRREEAGKAEIQGHLQLCIKFKATGVYQMFSQRKKIIYVKKINCWSSPESFSEEISVHLNISYGHYNKKHLKVCKNAADWLQKHCYWESQENILGYQLAENLCLEHKTLSYTNATLCVSLKINLTLQFSPRRVTSTKHSQKVHPILLSLGVRTLSYMPPTLASCLPSWALS